MKEGKNTGKDEISDFGKSIEVLRENSITRRPAAIPWY